MRETVRISLGAGFTGREVEEELPVSAFAELLAGGPRQNHDLLGLSWSTEDGETVVGTVSVGSGYERFVVDAEEVRKALEI